MAHATHEQKSFAALCQQYGFSHVQIIAPNTSAARIEALCTAGDGLIYAVARTGVTGAATELKPAEITSRIRAVTRLPIAVGFGIKAGEHVRLLRGHADLAIVGTETLAAYKSQGIEGVESLWKDLAAACI
jgi:tryptophan synthase alpha chain